jgi:hypothetical protein
MAQTQILPVSATWTLIPGTATSVTLSPNGRSVDMRVATTTTTASPPGAGINGHLLPNFAQLFQRSAGEGLWVRENSSAVGLSVCYTESA